VDVFSNTVYKYTAGVFRSQPGASRHCIIAAMLFSITSNIVSHTTTPACQYRRPTSVIHPLIITSLHICSVYTVKFLSSWLNYRPTVHQHSPSGSYTSDLFANMRPTFPILKSSVSAYPRCRSGQQAHAGVKTHAHLQHSLGGGQVKSVLHSKLLTTNRYAILAYYDYSQVVRLQEGFKYRRRGTSSVN